MTSYQSNSVAENLSKVADGLKAVFTTAVDDIKPINRVLCEVVNSGDTLNPTGNLRVSSDVDNFKHTIRQRLSAFDGFILAGRSAASHASNDRLLKSIKEELSKNSHQNLKSYLDTLKKRLRECTERLHEVKTNYRYIHSLGLQHKSRLHGRCLAGSGLLVGLGFFVAKFFFFSGFKSQALPGGGGGNSLNELNKSPRQSDQFYMYGYKNIILCLLIQIAIGIGCFYLATRHRRLQSREPGVKMLRLTSNSISDYLGKLEMTTSRIHELEQHVIEARDAEYLPNKEDAELIKAQLGKLQHEANVLLTFMPLRNDGLTVL